MGFLPSLVPAFALVLGLMRLGSGGVGQARWWAGEGGLHGLLTLSWVLRVGVTPPGASVLQQHIPRPMYSGHCSGGRA